MGRGRWVLDCKIHLIQIGFTVINRFSLQSIERKKCFHCDYSLFNMGKRQNVNIMGTRDIVIRINNPIETRKNERIVQEEGSSKYENMSCQ